ncbi:MAG: lycopene beta-cyclase CrtY [Methyloligellaceae bacterium]
MEYDIVFVGGGLANSLAAYRLKQKRPEVKFLIIEKNGTLGGEHTWSFHDTDIAPKSYDWLQPFIVAKWSKQQVKFPALNRTLNVGYNVIKSRRLHEIAGAELNDDILFGKSVRHLARNQIILSDGTKIISKSVLDGRGWRPDTGLALAYQKFVGLEVGLKNRHQQEMPVIMDATVPQIDGYRFVYILPLDDRRLLIEDTYYSPNSNLDQELIADRVTQYAADKGWEIETVTGLEKGILPIVLGGDIRSIWEANEIGVGLAGLAAVNFNYTTGYSLPDAVRFAESMSGIEDFAENQLHDFSRTYSLDLWRRGQFNRLLNRLLFKAAQTSEERVNIFQRFYGFSEDLICRFYAGNSTRYDKLRILSGKPPVGLVRAIRCLPAQSAFD